jgi:hypothetical protein
MFADDTKLFKEIRTENDAKQRQNDISNLESWSTTSGLSFNRTKCKAQTVPRKLKPITTSYTKNDCQLTSTKNERDLGVWISIDLKWNKQVNQQCACANKDLSYIRINTRTIHNTTTRRTIYLALVRSHLGYRPQVWTPQSVELLVKLEKLNGVGRNSSLTCHLLVLLTIHPECRLSIYSTSILLLARVPRYGVLAQNNLRPGFTARITPNELLCMVYSTVHLLSIK